MAIINLPGKIQMHPNQFTLVHIDRYFERRGFPCNVGSFEGGYVIARYPQGSRKHISVDDPVARIAYKGPDFWRLYWIDEHFEWKFFAGYTDLRHALEILLLFYQTAD